MGAPKALEAEPFALLFTAGLPKRPPPEDGVVEPKAPVDWDWFEEDPKSPPPAAVGEEPKAVCWFPALNPDWFALLVAPKALALDCPKAPVLLLLLLLLALAAEPKPPPAAAPPPWPGPLHPEA